MVSRIRSFITSLVNAENVTGYDYKASRANAVIFLMVVIVGYLTYSLMLNSWLFRSDIWAEAGRTNYFYAHHGSVLYRIFFDINTTTHLPSYIQFLPRFFAYLATILQLPAVATARYYAWMAWILSTFFVTLFCLPYFRLVLKSDFLRFCTVTLILFATNWEMKTYTNCMYFSLFFILITSAFSLKYYNNKVPWFIWLLPFLMLNKPYIFTLLPIMLLVVMCAPNTKIRFVFLLSLLILPVQIVITVIGHQHGVLHEYSDPSLGLLHKAIAGFVYFLNLNGYLFLPTHHQSGKFFIGIFLLVIWLFVIFKCKGVEKTIMLLALITSLSSACLNTVAFPLAYYPYEILEQQISLSRWTFTMLMSYSVLIFSTASYLSSLINTTLPAKKNLNKWFNLIVICLTVFWTSRAISTNKPYDFPRMVSNSVWKDEAFLLDGQVNSLCIPIQPLGWIYGTKCIQLKPFLFVEPYQKKMGKVIKFNVSTVVSSGILKVIGLPVRTIQGTTQYVTVKAMINLKNGKTIIWQTVTKISGQGALVALQGGNQDGITGVKSIEIKISQPVYYFTKNISPLVELIGFKGR